MAVADKIPKEAILVLRGVKPFALVEDDHGKFKKIRNYAEEMTFLGSELKTAEQFAKEWLAKGCWGIILDAKTFDGKFWTFNPITGKWSTFAQMQAVAARKKAA